MTAPKYKKIKPNYIKNEKGQTTEVYLDVKTYEAIVTKLNEFEEIKKKLKKNKISK